jgi:hypothetical protein
MERPPQGTALTRGGTPPDCLPAQAPQLQPDVTEFETTAAQSIHMRRTTETEQRAAAPAASLPEYRPWREVGWIFSEGGCVAIERQGTDIDPQALVD